MQLFTAQVTGGVIPLPDGVELPSGTRVTVIIEGPEEPVELSPAQEAELDEAIAEAERGEVISAAELFRRLSRE